MIIQNVQKDTNVAYFQILVKKSDNYFKITVHQILKIGLDKRLFLKDKNS